MMAFQFHENDSFMHNISPIPKIIWLISISILVFIYESALPMFILLVLTFLMSTVLAKLSPLFVLRGIWIMLLFGVGFFILQVIFVPGETLWFNIWILPVYVESVDFAMAITLRILTIFTSSLMFVVTTDPRDIVLTLSQKLNVPYRYSYSIFIALRFVPTLESESKVIEAAQTIRGVGKQKGLKNKIENFKRFSMPLLMGAIRRVRTTANTMEAKGYGAYPDRTYIREVHLTNKCIAFATIWILLPIGLMVYEFV